MCTIEWISIIIALFALVATFISVYYSRKNAHSQIFIQLVEKESLYMTHWNNKETDDAMWQYINLFETIALLYKEKEVNRNLVKRYFINVLKDIYLQNNEQIEKRINEDDFEELNYLLREWNIK